MKFTNPARFPSLLLAAIAVAAFFSGQAGAQPFSTWIIDQGILEGQRAPRDNPSGDGIPNLIKFALGLNPAVSSRHLLPQAEFITHEGEKRPSLTIAKNPSASGISWMVEASSDLVSWTSEGLTIVTDTAETLTVVDTVEGDGPRFLRLAVTLAEDGPPADAYLFVVGGRTPSAAEPNLDVELDAVHLEVNVMSILVADIDLTERSVGNWRRAGLLPTNHFDGGGILHWSYVHDHAHVHQGRLYVGPATFNGTGPVTADFVAWADIDAATGMLGQFQTSDRLPPNPANQRLGSTAIVEVDGVYYYYILGGNADGGQTSRVVYAAIDAETGAIGPWQIATTSMKVTDWFHTAIGHQGRLLNTSGNLGGWAFIDWITPDSGGNLTSFWDSVSYDFNGNRWDHVMVKAEVDQTPFVYLIGGTTEGGSVLDRVDLIQLPEGIPANLTESQPLPEPRRRLAGAAFKDMIIIPGGSTTTSFVNGTDTVFIGNVGPGGEVVWQVSDIPMMQARSFHGAAIAPGPNQP